MRTVPKSIKGPDWAVTGIPKGECLLTRTKTDILDAKGQEAMRKVCKPARGVLDITAAGFKPGVTTEYLDEICHKGCIERDVRATLFRMFSLLTSAVTSFALKLQPLPQIAVHFCK
jgi:methionyl aminopeptidase